MPEHEVLHSPEFIEGTRQGIEDWRAGQVKPLSEALAKMTQTIDPEHATVEQICRWLAEQPCPKPWGWGPASGKVKHAPDCTCNGTGLAFEWASKPCICGGDTCLCGACALYNAVESGSGAHTRDCACNGSGRVPKALGLEELLKIEPNKVLAALDIEYSTSILELREPDFILVALRAVAVAVGMTQEEDA